MSSGHWEIELKWRLIFPNFVNNWLSDLEYVARGNISYNDLNIEIQYRGKELDIMKNNGYWTMIFKLFLLTRCVSPQVMLNWSTIRWWHKQTHCIYFCGKQKPINRPWVWFQLMVNSVFYSEPQNHRGNRPIKNIKYQSSYAAIWPSLSKIVGYF